FPIAFDRAEIHGTELKLEIPRWGAWSGFASYSYLRGTGFLPITGGLLLGDDAASALTATNAFPITQDQRHTMRGRVAYQLSDRAWVAMAVSYGSGLPVEFVGDPAQALAQYGPRIVGQVDFDEERVRPSASIDAAFSAIVFKTERTIARAQVNVVNLTDRLNVINFASLFSGTALGPPRSFGFGWQLDFKEQVAKSAGSRGAAKGAAPPRSESGRPSTGRRVGRRTQVRAGMPIPNGRGEEFQ